LTPQTGRPVQ